MQVYEGIVKDQVVVLPQDVQLEEGIQVEVRVRQLEPASLEDLYKKRLVKAGLIEEIRRAPQDGPQEERTPVQVEGKPLSQMIVEERR